MAFTILKTKLYPPPRRSESVPRSHLTERFRSTPQVKLILIAAPAGFGKSTLASELLANSTIPGAWLSLDEGDRDPTRFIGYVVAALQNIYPNIGANILTELQTAQPPPVDVVLPSLLNQIASQQSQGLLVLDDYHVLDSQTIDHILGFIVEHLPPQLHLLVATREDPNLPLARLRAKGQLVEFRAADLRFSLEEATTFLNQSMGLKLSKRNVQSLEERTEGWITGLQLAALSLQRQNDVGEFIKDFTGGHHFVLDYLLEETLQRQNVELQNFLLDTAILERLDSAICAAVTHCAVNEAQQRIEQVEQANLFIIPLDSTRHWYRYHHLFADVLQARLRSVYPERFPELHLRASMWFEKSGEYPDAIRHALQANNYDRAADLIELAWPKADRYVQTAPWLGWLKLLPDTILSVRPVLQDIFIWALIDVGEIERAEACLTELSAWVDRVQRSNKLPTPPPPEVTVVDQSQYANLLSSIATAYGCVAQTRGDLQSAIAHHKRASELRPPHGASDGIPNDALLGLAYLSAGELDKAYGIFNEGIEKLKKTGRMGYAIGISMLLTDLRLVQGRLFDAHKLTNRFKQFLPASRPYPQGSIYIFIAEAKVYLAWNQLDEAERAIKLAEDVDKDSPLVLGQYRLSLVKARVQQIKGNWQESLDLLDDAEKLYYRNVVPEFQPAAAQKTRALIKLGRLYEAWAWAEELGLSTEAAISFSQEYDYLTYARLLIATEKRAQRPANINNVVRILERIETQAAKESRHSILVETLVQLSVVRLYQQNENAALATLEKAINIAKPENFQSAFIEEATTLAPLLHKVEKNTAMSSFVRDIINSIHVDASSADKIDPPHRSLVEPLSKREIQILALIANGLSNQEISEKLFIALSSVKGHNQKIFGKLQVQRRTEAVAKARELNLI